MFEFLTIFEIEASFNDFSENSFIAPAMSRCLFSSDKLKNVWDGTLSVLPLRSENDILS